MTAKKTLKGNKPRWTIFKIITLSILVIFSMNFYVLPSVFAVTVEEQAGKNAKDSISSGDDEFVRKTPARRAAAGSAEEKDPRLACLLSLIIPGGGQIYLKKDLKGVAFFSLSVVGYSAAGYYLYKALAGDISGAEKKSKIVISGLFFLLGIIFHVVGIVEAYNDAIEINEKSYYYGGYSKSPHIAVLEMK
jgi:hypothetical protein